MHEQLTHPIRGRRGEYSTRYSTGAEELKNNFLWKLNCSACQCYGDLRRGWTHRLQAPR
jgi:hypothetical protein